MTSKPKIVVVYGSGASYDSGYQVMGGAPPIDQKFFEILGSKINHYGAVSFFKNSYFHNLSKPPSLEELWSAVDLNHKHITLDTYSWEKATNYYVQELQIRLQAEKQGNHTPTADLSNSVLDYKNSDLIGDKYTKYKFLGDVARELRKLIYDVYSNFHITEAKSAFVKLHQKLIEAKHDVVYVTFNYDCFLEDSLQKIGQEFFYVNGNFVTSASKLLFDSRMYVVKLHGSLNWKESVSGRVELDDRKLDGVKPVYSSDTEWIQAAIIPPTQSKQEVNDDSRESLSNTLTQVLLSQWRAAITALGAADKILIAGYSFPGTDFHSKRIFHIANMNHADKGPFYILDCGGKNDDTEERKTMLQKIFGNNVKRSFHAEFSSLSESKELQKFLQPP